MDQEMLGRRVAGKWDWCSRNLALSWGAQGPEFPTHPRTCARCQGAFTEVPENMPRAVRPLPTAKNWDMSMLGRPRVTEEIPRTDYFVQGLPSPRGGRTTRTLNQVELLEPPKNLQISAVEAGDNPDEWQILNSYAVGVCRCLWVIREKSTYKHAR